MPRLAKLMLSSILITLIVLGLNSPVSAQIPPPPTVYVEAPPFVNVSTEFDIIIWIRNIYPGYGMVWFDLQAQWDPNDLEYIECEFLRAADWQGGCGNTPPGYWTGLAGGPIETEDYAWFRIRFHCLREGAAPITITSVDTVWLKPLGGGVEFHSFPEPVTVTIQQVEYTPVGGISTSVNKLEILTPYLALAGLIAAISAIYVVKRRKD
ncbi:hypothetical protein [[Eubacterium] cellulosolvens]